MGSNKYIITKIKCWPVFKEDPSLSFVLYLKCFNCIENLCLISDTRALTTPLVLYLGVVYLVP